MVIKMKTISLSDNRELHIHSDRFSIYSQGLRLFSFYVSSSVNTYENTDYDTSVSLTSCAGSEFVWTAANSSWDKKEYILRVIDGCLLFRIRVAGHGVLDKIDYFKGEEGSIGSKFAVAGYLLVNSQNKDRERSKFLVDVEPAELIPLRAAPPPFVFPFWNDHNDDWIGVGAASEAGGHNYQKFTFHAPRNGWSENGCWFTLDFEGYTEVDGEWVSPMMWCGFGCDDMGVLAEYARWQYDNLGYKRNIPASEAPKWWRMPIFCGWGAQCGLRISHPGSKAPDFARQDIYEMFSDKLDELDLRPGTIMIDDKWQTEYGTLEVDKEKWPSLRGFVDAQHAKGRRVVLWLRCWHPEGLPEDECILVDGEPFCADPTNPKYLARLRAAIYHLLSDDEGCCGCDGFKVDFMDCFPRMAGAVAHEKGVYGLEMMKRLFDAIYDYAKEAKHDALVNMSSVHPYFSGTCDQFRIHDYDPNLRSPVSTMKFRAEFAGAVMPDVLVDMDGFNGFTLPEVLRCVLKNAEFGVPDLYFFPESFGDDEWRRLREAWDTYRERIED